MSELKESSSNGTLAVEGVHHFLTEKCEPKPNFRELEDEYDPNQTYWMVDFTSKQQLKWWRNPYQTLEQVAELAQGAEGDTDDFRVLSEDYLDLPRENFDTALDCYVPEIFSNRFFFFDGRNENVAHFISGKPSLCKSNEEDLETWFKRIDADPRTEYTRWKGAVEVKDGKFVRASTSKEEG